MKKFGFVCIGGRAAAAVVALNMVVNVTLAMVTPAQTSTCMERGADEHPLPSALGRGAL